MTEDGEAEILPEAVDGLVRQAMADYRSDPVGSDFLLRYACSQAADPLPLYRVLYKFYNRQRHFEPAGEFARAALDEAARRGDLPADVADWSPEMLDDLEPGLASQVLLALKALAFIGLRGGDEAGAGRHLEILQRLDPADGSGVSVVTALAESLRREGHAA